MEEKRRRDAEARASEIEYINNIQLLSNVLTLPHLEVLIWEDSDEVPQSFFNLLALSPVKHLKLFRVFVEDEFKIDLLKCFDAYR